MGKAPDPCFKQQDYPNLFHQTLLQGNKCSLIYSIVYIVNMNISRIDMLNIWVVPPTKISGSGQSKYFFSVGWNMLILNADYASLCESNPLGYHRIWFNGSNNSPCCLSYWTAAFCIIRPSNWIYSLKCWLNIGFRVFMNSQQIRSKYTTTGAKTI